MNMRQEINLTGLLPGRAKKDSAQRAPEAPKAERKPRFARRAKDTTEVPRTERKARFGGRRNDAQPGAEKVDRKPKVRRGSKAAKSPAET